MGNSKKPMQDEERGRSGPTETHEQDGAADSYPGELSLGGAERLQFTKVLQGEFAEGQADAMIVLKEAVKELLKMSQKIYIEDSDELNKQKLTDLFTLLTRIKEGLVLRSQPMSEGFQQTILLCETYIGSLLERVEMGRGITVDGVDRLIKKTGKIRDGMGALRSTSARVTGPVRPIRRRDDSDHELDFEPEEGDSGISDALDPDERVPVTEDEYERHYVERGEDDDDDDLDEDTGDFGENSLEFEPSGITDAEGLFGRRGELEDLIADEPFGDTLTSLPEPVDEPLASDVIPQTESPFKAQMERIREGRDEELNSAAILELVVQVLDVIGQGETISIEDSHDLIKSLIEQIKRAILGFKMDPQVRGIDKNYAYVSGAMIPLLEREVLKLDQLLSRFKRAEINSVTHLVRHARELYNRYHEQKISTNEFPSVAHLTESSRFPRITTETSRLNLNEQHFRRCCRAIGARIEAGDLRGAIRIYNKMRRDKKKAEAMRKKREDDTGIQKTNELEARGITNTCESWKEIHERGEHNFMAEVDEPDRVTQRIFEILKSDPRFKEFFHTKNKVLEFGTGYGNDAVKFWKDFPNVVEYIGFDGYYECANRTANRLSSLMGQPAKIEIKGSSDRDYREVSLRYIDELIRNGKIEKYLMKWTIVKNGKKVVLHMEDFKKWMMSESHTRSSALSMPDDERQIVNVKSTLHYDLETIFKTVILPSIATLINSGDGLLILALKSPESDTWKDHEPVYPLHREAEQDGYHVGVHREECLLRAFIEKGKLADELDGVGFDMDNAVIEEVVVEGYDEDGKLEKFILVMARLKKPSRATKKKPNKFKRPTHKESDGDSKAEIMAA